MRVEATLVNHPKFLRLKKTVGDIAMECLVRLWGHCEGAQKGELWRGADAEYIEVVAQWPGAPGVLYKALVLGKIIEVVRGGHRIHDWEALNSRAVSNWALGHRPKRSQGLAKAQAQDQPELSNGSSRMSERVTERTNEAGNKNGAGAGLAEVTASRTQWAALSAGIKELQGRGNDLDAAERADLRKKREALVELEKKQAKGNFK